MPSDSLIAKSKKLIRLSAIVRKEGVQLVNKSGTLRSMSKFLRDKSIGGSNANTSCILKKCNKCGSIYYPSTFLNLPLLGYQKSEDIDGEMRNCPCKTTLFYITRRPVPA